MIDIVQNNPYRILGIYSNSPTKERVANSNKLKAFIKVGKPVSFQLDLPSLLSPINRTAEDIAKADSELTLPKDQLRYAQFWFIKVTPLDDIAMNHLIAGNIDSAVSIWEKKESASSLQNRIVCALMQENYSVAINCADKLYSNYSTDFAIAVLGESHTVSTDKIEYNFLDELCSAVGTQKILPYIESNDNWHQYVLGKTINPLIETLQSAIDDSKSSRGKGAKARLASGTKLMNETKETLAQLRALIPQPNEDLQYQAIADKLGGEILQCGIDYYNGIETVDAARKALELQSYALSIVIGKMAKDRCKENGDILLKNIAYLPPSEEVIAEDKAINAELNKFLQQPEKICHAVTLLNNTKPYLQAIKTKLGANNSYYLKLSTRVVSNALHNIIVEVNAAQKISSMNPLNTGSYLQDVLKRAWNATKLMDSFDITSDFKYNYTKSRTTLKQICEQKDVPTSLISSIGITEKAMDDIKFYIKYLAICALIGGIIGFVFVDDDHTFGGFAAGAGVAIVLTIVGFLISWINDKS